MNIYNISPSLPFLDTLAKTVLAKYGQDPLVFSNITIFLPNRRACRALQESFLRTNEGAPMLLPQILPLGDAEDESFIFRLQGVEDLDLPNVISPAQQRLILTELIEKWQKLLGTGEKITTPQAAYLAIELSSFLGEVAEQQLSFDNIEGIVPEDLSKHWQVTLRFLSILIEQWPKILNEKKASDIHGKRNELLNMQAKYWKDNPSEYPVIAAGSTGSIPATANLLKTIAKMPHGHLVLPGLDNHMSDEAWENIAETHPQYGLKSLLDNLEVKRTEIKSWGEGEPLKSRERLVSAIMCPAESAISWQNLDKKIAEDLSSLEVIITKNLNEEAAAIALIMKEALQVKGKTTALITNNRGLARHVSAILSKWGVNIDDSAGRELSNTPQAVFLRLIAQVISDKAKSPVSLLNLLKHPFAANGSKTVEFRNNVRKLEVATLRGIRKSGDISSLYKDLQDEALKNWLKGVEDELQPLIKIASLKEIAFEEILTKHIKTAEALATTDEKSGAMRLWAGENGEQLKDFLDEVFVAAKGFKKIDPIDYAGLLDALLAGQVFRPPYGTHPRLFILSPMEARMLEFDLVIMADLNEGSWPSIGKADPWMSRPMRSNFGLPLPEKRIGQSAHDFAQLLCSPRVILTRSEKPDGTLAIPSRWLLRLDAVLKILNAKDKIDPKKPWQQWAKILNRPDFIKSCEAPAPNPPMDIRPNKLSVTAIEKLMRDPYSIYASKILKLKALDPIDKDPGAAEFGNFVHDALEIFTKKYDEIMPENKLNFLLECGRKVLAEQNYGGAVEAFWWPRFERIADWFVANEIVRRGNAEKILSEVKGKYIISNNGREFTLEARADRIEINSEGEISIIDYKTGTVPAKGDVALGLSPQMTLEGVIANSGGFAIEGKTVELGYWRLTGGEKPVEISDAGKNTEGLISDAQGGVKGLIDAMFNNQTAFLPCPDPEKAPRYNDYEHLERMKEWAD